MKFGKFRGIRRFVKVRKERRRGRRKIHIEAHLRFVFLAQRLFEFEVAPYSDHVCGVSRIEKSASMMSYESSGCKVERRIVRFRRFRRFRKRRFRRLRGFKKDIGLEDSADQEELGDLKDLDALVDLKDL